MEWETDLEEMKGVELLYDNIAIDNQAIKLFLKDANVTNDMIE